MSSALSCLVLARRAAMQTATYVARHMPGAPNFRHRFDRLRHGLAKAGPRLFLEFGVASGESINFIADERPDRGIRGRGHHPLKV
jgi:hypothetical protein